MQLLLLQLLVVAADKARRDPIRLRRAWREHPYKPVPTRRATTFERFQSDIGTWYTFVSQRLHTELANADHPT